MKTKNTFLKGKKYIIVLTIISTIFCFGIFSSCTETRKGSPKNYGMFFTLKEAFEQGIISTEALKTIAYYQNGDKETADFIPFDKDPENLNEQTENEIKQSYAYSLRNQFKIEDAVTENVHLLKYYGTYGDCVAVMLSDAYHGYDNALFDDSVGGVTIHYTDGKRIVVWKRN